MLSRVPPPLPRPFWPVWHFGLWGYGLEVRVRGLECGVPSFGFLVLGGQAQDSGLST